MRDKLFTLTRSQREDLWRRYKQTSERRVAERLHAILLLDEGRSGPDVSTILHLHPKTRTRWIRIFAATGVAGLATFNYVGNTPWLSDDQIQQFSSWLDGQVRSTKAAIAWVETHFGMDYTESGMRKLLKRRNYRYKKPAQVPAKADVAAQTAWLEGYVEKRAIKGHGKVYFVDAAHLLHNAVPGQGWIKRGTTVELKTNSGRNRLNVLGAYSPDDHTLVSIEGTESCDADVVGQLLRKLRQANHGKRQLVVLANASYQRAKSVQALAKRLRIRLLFLPPYSPNLNLIERFWKFLRKKITRNT